MTNTILSNHPKQFKRKRLFKVPGVSSRFIPHFKLFFPLRLRQQDHHYRENLDDGDTLKVLPQIGTKKVSHKATW